MTTFNLLNLKTALLGTLTGTLFLGTGLFSPVQSISLEGLESEIHESSNQDLHAQFELPSNGPATPLRSEGGGVRGSDSEEWEESWEEEWEEENTVNTDLCNSDLEDEGIEVGVDEITDLEELTLEDDPDVEIIEDEISTCEVELEEAETLEEEEEFTLESYSSGGSR